MFGQIDKWYSKLKFNDIVKDMIYPKNGKITFTDKFKVQFQENKKCKGIWLCFPGWTDDKVVLKNQKVVAKPHNVSITFNLIPKCRLAIIYHGPISIAGRTPYEAIHSIHLIAKDIDKRLEEASKKLGITKREVKEQLNVFCFSAGTLPGFYFANKYKAKKLVAMAPGPGMGKGIFTSEGSKPLKRKVMENGYKTYEEYDKILDKHKINQMQNMDNLPSGKNLIIFGGKCDKFILFNEGTKIVIDELIRKGKNPTTKIYKFFDHGSLALWIGFRNIKGKDPYEIED